MSLSEFGPDLLSDDIIALYEVNTHMAERSRNRLVVFVTMTPYYTANTEDESCITIYEGDEGFREVADAMADECDLYHHRGMLYNMPARVNPPPPYHCVTRGRYIGVFESNSW
jgi:hypothetical protein